MRSIETITTDMEANAARRQSITKHINEKVAEFRAALEEVNREETSALLKESNELYRELESAKAAAAAHPLEGVSVWSRVRRFDRSYSLRAHDKWVTLRGRIVVVRSWEDMPPINKASLHRPSPSIGDVIIQRLNAKGERLGEWVKLCTDGSLPRDWKTSQEALVA